MIHAINDIASNHSIEMINPVFGREDKNIRAQLSPACSDIKFLLTLKML